MQGSEDVATEAIDEGFEDAVAKTVASLAQRIDVLVRAEADSGPTQGARRDSHRRRRRK